MPMHLTKSVRGTVRSMGVKPGILSAHQLSEYLGCSTIILGTCHLAHPQAVPWLLQLISGSHGASSWCHHGPQSRTMQAGAELQHFEWHSQTSCRGDFCPCTWSRPPPLHRKERSSGSPTSLVCGGWKDPQTSHWFRPNFLLPMKLKSTRKEK